MPLVLCGVRKRHFAEYTLFPGGQNYVSFENVIDRLSIDDGVRTGRIVSYHAAERGAVGRGSIGAEQKARGLEMKIELFLHDARLDESPAVPLYSLRERDSSTSTCPERQLRQPSGLPGSCPHLWEGLAR